MRVALLSMIEAVPGDAGGLRATLPIGGRTIVRHQLGLALALGCARVVVLTEGFSGEIVALQHVAEAGGARFHAVTAVRALAPLIAPEDELFVLADGLLAMPDDVLSLLGDGNVVVTMPVETGLPAGFERIDINHAGAGAMRIPGRIAAGLSDLPPDWNPLSALLRLAVQAGVAQRSLPGASFEQGRWRLIRSEEDAHAAEPGWLRLHTASAHRRSPGETMAALAVQSAGPALLHAGTSPAIVGLAALLVLLLGLGAGWFGYATAGFLLLGGAWLLRQCSALLGRIERDSLLAGLRTSMPDIVFGWVLDGAFVALSAWRSEILAIAGLPWGLAWFAPLGLLLLLRLLPMVFEHGWLGYWLADRLLLGAGLALVSLALPFDLVIRIAVIGLLVGHLVLATRRNRLEDALANPGLTNRA